MPLKEAANSDFKKDLSDSIYDFKRAVLPKMLAMGHIQGEVYPVEEVTAHGYEKLVKQFDILAGVDLWQITNGCGIRALASRLQWGRNYQTFTIRAKRTSGAETELAKRLRAIENGDYLYPHYTLQAYLSSRRSGELLSYALIKTTDLFDCIETCKTFEMTNKADGNLFVCINWSEIVKNGVNISIYDHQMCLF